MNEIWDVIGKKSISFTDKVTGSVIEGFRLYLSRLSEPEDKSDGYICDSVFVTVDKCPSIPEIDDQIILRYNRYGKIGSIEIV